MDVQEKELELRMKKDKKRRGKGIGLFVTGTILLLIFGFLAILFIIVSVNITAGLAEEVEATPILALFAIFFAGPLAVVGIFFIAGAAIGAAIGLILFLVGLPLLISGSVKYKKSRLAYENHVESINVIGTNTENIFDSEFK